MRRLITLLGLLFLVYPANATIAVVAHVAAANTSASGTATTAGINTTGADSIYIGIGSYGVPSCTSLTVGDSNSNTWTAIANAGASSDSQTCIFYKKAPTVGAGHTFHVVASSGGYSAITVLAVSGTLTTGGPDVHSEAEGTSTTAQPGSVTPSVNNEIVVTISATLNAGTTSIDSGFTISDTVAFSAGASVGTSMAYLIQTTATAENPTWTTTSAQGSLLTACIAAFKPSAGGGATVVKRKRPGVF